MRCSHTPSTDDEITKALFVCDDSVPADLAVVFGAASTVDMVRRITHGVQLYERGFVRLLLVTGGTVLANRAPESRRMAEIACELGVPEHHLVVEDRSRNTFQNAKFSFELLSERHLLGQMKTVILVSSEWHMRRVSLTVKKYFPATVRFVCCPTLDGCNRDNWTNSAEYRRTILHELDLLMAFQATGEL